MQITRKWSMPKGDTFSVPAIREFVECHTAGCAVIVDPFARNSKVGTITNDLNPETTAEHHLDAREFCRLLQEKGIQADAVIFDPPYSPRQISELYRRVGLTVGQKETQTARLYRECRLLLGQLLRPGGVALSFGWNSAGFGKGFEAIDLLLVAHGGAHNDTICQAHRKLSAR